MATTGIPNSTLVRIRVGSTPVAVARLTDSSLRVGHSVRDITTKDSAGWKEIAEGLRDWSMSGSALWEYAASSTANVEDLFLANVTTRTAITVEFGSGVSGDPKISGSAYCTSFEASSPTQEDNLSVTFELEGNGALTVGTY